MRIEGRRTFAVDSKTLWYLLHDPYTLRKALPDCVSLEVAAPDEYRFVLDTRIGPDAQRLTGALRFNTLEPQRSFEFEAESDNPSGTLSARGRARLEPEGDDLTTLVYQADIEPGREFAQMSPRLLQTTMNAIGRRSLEALEERVARRSPGYVAVTPQTGAPQTAGDAARRPTLAGRLAPYYRLLAAGSVLLALLLIVRVLVGRRSRSAIHQALEIAKGASAGGPPSSRSDAPSRSRA